MNYAYVEQRDVVIHSCHNIIHVRIPVKVIIFKDQKDMKWTSSNIMTHADFVPTPHSVAVYWNAVIKYVSKLCF